MVANRSVVGLLHSSAGLAVPLLLPCISAVFVRDSEWSKRKVCVNCVSHKTAVVLNCPHKYSTFSVYKDCNMVVE